METLWPDSVPERKDHALRVKPLELSREYKLQWMWYDRINRSPICHPNAANGSQWCAPSLATHVLTLTVLLQPRYYEEEDDAIEEFDELVSKFEGLRLWVTPTPERERAAQAILDFTA